MKDRYNININSEMFLRTIEEKDIEYLRVLINKYRKFFFYSKEITPEEQLHWFNKYMLDERDYSFVVCKVQDGKEENIGTVALYDINELDGSSEFGRIMVDHEKIKEKGIGLLVTQAISAFAKEQLHLGILKLEVYEDNIPAIKTYLKSGFIEVGKEIMENSPRRVLLMEKKLV